VDEHHSVGDQAIHACVSKLDLFDLDTQLMTSIGPVCKQQETSSRYCVANGNLCNVRRYCKLLMLQHIVLLGTINTRTRVNVTSLLLTYISDT
jgi:hypothetical protein